MLTPVIDTSKEYGLVLEGGGAKGAYQIGAWEGTERSRGKDQCCGRNKCRSIEWRADLYG